MQCAPRSVVICNDVRNVIVKSFSMFRSDIIDLIVDVLGSILFTLLNSYYTILLQDLKLAA